MRNKRVVITGVGVFTGNGKGKQEYFQALRDGKVGYGPITLFDAEEFVVRMGGEVKDFDAKEYLGQKGLRTQDRATKLVSSAARLAIDDSGFEITDENTDSVGMAVGCTLGSLKSIAEFDEVTVREGPRYVNPALFPNTTLNSPAAHAAIWTKIEGFNVTLCTGFTASVDAMIYANDFIQFERVKLAYAGGVEEFCYHTYYGFHTMKFLSGAKKNETFVNCPFDKRRNGITFGEGACMLALEEREHAEARGANIMAEILGFGSCFDPFRAYKYNPRGTGVKASIRKCLADAELEPKDIDYICANANSTVIADRVETEAIKEIFGKRAYDIPVSAVKSMTGECYSASGSFAVAASVAALTEGFIPPTVNYQDKDPTCDLDYVPNKSREAKLNKVLVITFGPGGNNSCVILGRP